ncbi:hypothetical protein [Streptosporangium carneum]|uniref:Uncharacterized protein n=1 Tax=Streptosporangium carneum TaxID=47481 RepID=A0A9W6I2B3_9ACTN|nr:hypothetical protein [Streptosporangium carneum]GLK10725.1 hypothetical protein GCM10017600_41310 [Streptosporangium carneum]
MMNAREPDWAYVARSLVKVLAVAAALFLALGAIARVLWVFVDSDERTAQVYGTAARVANPDKRLSYADDDGGLLETTYTLWGEPRRAGRDERVTRYDITEDLFGTVWTSSLDGPSGSLGDAIDSVEEDPEADKELTEKARKTIDGLPQTLDAVAVVEFARSMTTDRLVAFNRRHKLCGGADVSYIYAPSPYYDDSSSDPPLNAVVWNRNMTEGYIRADFSYQCETEPEPALAEFRRWVGLLDEGDDLRAFELDHGWLAETAKAGVVHGLVIDRWKLADLRKLLDDPEVRTVRLADVAFDLGETE